MFVFIFRHCFAHVCVRKYEDHQYHRRYCKITQIPGDIPVEAKKVYLYGNSITSINPRSFSRLEDCTELWLSGNKLTKISLGMFEGLESLELVTLHDNSVVSIEVGVFRKLTHCTQIKLDSNRLRQIKEGMFAGLNVLEELSLTMNGISYIEPGSFKSLMQLSKLYLYSNELTTLEQNVFNFPYHPVEVTLLLFQNPLKCNSSLCWVKQGEREGWISWYYDFTMFPPECENYPGVAWTDVKLPCSVPGKR